MSQNCLAKAGTLSVSAKGGSLADPFRRRLEPKPALPAPFLRRRESLQDARALCLPRGCQSKHLFRKAPTTLSSFLLCLGDASLRRASRSSLRAEKACGGCDTRTLRRLCRFSDSGEEDGPATEQQQSDGKTASGASRRQLLSSRVSTHHGLEVRETKVGRLSLRPFRGRPIVCALNGRSFLVKKKQNPDMRKVCDALKRLHGNVPPHFYDGRRRRNQRS